MTTSTAFPQAARDVSFLESPPEQEFPGFFATNTLFDGIPEEIIAQIVAEILVVELEAGEVLFREGDPGESLFLIERGSVRISKQGRGAEQETLAIISAGAFFGEMALLDGEPRSAQATAIKPTVLGCVDEVTFRRILEVAPASLHMNFLKSVVKRLRGVNSHFISEVMRAERLSLVGSMASGIVHDLKNPLSVILCCADVLENNLASAKDAEFTHAIRKSVESVLMMTDDLLDYTRGRVVVNIEPVPVLALLAELDDTTFRLLPNYKVQLEKLICYTGLVPIDMPRFIRVLDNLVKNSRQAMPLGGTIELLVEDVEDSVVFRLKDSGMGMPSEILSKIFEPFVSHGKKNGTGLGMAIAKSVVEAHHGTIHVTSSPGVGTTVEIRIPRVGR